MFRNYLITAIRNLRRQRLFSGLNIVGLGTGMACSILIFLWVQDERSYDRSHPDAENVYRLTTHLSGIDAAVVPIPIAMAVRQQLPAVTNTTRLSILRAVVAFGDRRFDEEHIYYTDSNCLRIFNFPLLAGDPASLLKDISSMAITEDAAIKYFGSAAAAMGKTLHINNSSSGSDCRVTAILKNIPANSHLQFNMLLPISLYERFNPSSWGNYDVYTYFKLDGHFRADQASLHTLEKKINEIREQNDGTKTKGHFSLQRLTDIHLDPRLLLDVDGGGNRQYVTIFSIVAVIILLIACVNFMNLSTAVSGRRAREVGLRKTVGALRSQLIIQFLGESLLLSAVSLVFALIVAGLLLPLFNQLAAKNISLHLLNLRLMAQLLGITLAVGLIAGSYPALFLSSFNPIKVLKGVKVLHNGKSFFRNGLVVLQFAVSVVLIIGTIVVYRQLQFIHHRDIGYEKENLLYVNLPLVGDLGNNYRSVRAALEKYPDIGSHTLISHLPTYLSTGTTSVDWPGKRADEQPLFPQLWVDDHFANAFGIHMAAGRFFDGSFRGDDSSFVVNETAVRIMGMQPESAIGQIISYNEHRAPIIGVVKDFNFKPIQQPIEPLVLHNATHNGEMGGNAGLIVIRTAPSKMRGILSTIQGVFQDVYPSYPFSYGFINDDLNKLYASEQQMGRLFNVFSVLSVIISCLGLFGLAAFATQRRVKEIGVRKVLGAGEAGIVALLSKEFIGLVMISLLIGFPVAGWVMQQWLSHFVYRIGLSWWIFALAGFIAIGIAMLTVSYQSIRAAMANPVKSLRSE